MSQVLAVNAGNTELALALLGFGVIALLVLAFVDLQKSSAVFSANFMVLSGFVVIAVLGAFVMLTSVTDGARAPVYALLGALAGYLGAKIKPDGAASKPKAPGDAA
jgi:ABC-type Fe3+-siderophore transport system permease subunit